MAKRATSWRLGYIAQAPLPSCADRAWARSTCQPDLDEVLFPAYALDCTARLVTWNAYLPRLLGLLPDAPLPASLTERSMLFSWFDPSTRLGATVLEPATLHPAMSRALRSELEQYQSETWPEDLIAALLTMPRFRAVWMTIASEPLPASARRARVPLRLQVPGAGTLEFRLAAEPFARDPRFRTILLFPADLPTIRWCAACAESDRERHRSRSSRGGDPPPPDLQS